MKTKKSAEKLVSPHSSTFKSQCRHRGVEVAQLNSPLSHSRSVRMLA